jgi:hypothetical protein
VAQPVFPTFDIFSGHFKQNDVTWMEAHEDLPAAYQKMLQIAADQPGPYFILSTNDAQTCVASVDTSPPQGAPQGNRKGHSA